MAHPPHPHPEKRHHSHDHSHDHHHAHHHLSPDHGRAFVIAIALNSLFVGIEFAYGFIANSTALMADAGHNLSDVLGLLLAWGAALLARKAPTARYTYGLRSSSILAALANAIVLLLTCAAIAWEAAQRFAHPPAVGSVTIMLVAAVGIVVNGLSAWLFAHGSKDDLNIRGAYWHMLADAAISLGVVLAGVVMWFTGWYWLDALLSLAIVAVIARGTWGLLRESLQLALSAVPPHIDSAAVATYLRQCPGVTDVHDLHIWGISTTESALTAHLHMPQGHPSDSALQAITHTLQERFRIHHSTLQITQNSATLSCALNPRVG